jgi:hypothetical protein
MRIYDELSNISLMAAELGASLGSAVQTARTAYSTGDFLSQRWLGGIGLQ